MTDLVWIVREVDQVARRERDDPSLGSEDEHLSCSRSIFRLCMNSVGSVVSVCQSTIRCNRTRISAGFRCSL